MANSQYNGNTESYFFMNISSITDNVNIFFDVFSIYKEKKGAFLANRQI